MNRAQIDNILQQLLGSHLDEWWERDELTDKLVAMPHSLQKQVLRQLPVIWPVSYALFMAFVDEAGRAGSCLSPEQFDEWVKATLDVYEEHGLRQAQIFMREVESNFVCRLRGEDGIRLREVEGRLRPYAIGLLGREVAFATGPRPAFDTETLFLPEETALFPGREQNFLFLKFTITFQLMLERAGVFSFRPPPLDRWLNGFACRRQAEELYYLAEAARITALMEREFPGLMRDCRPLFSLLFRQHRPGGEPVGRMQGRLLEKIASPSSSPGRLPATEVERAFEAQFDPANGPAAARALVEDFFSAQKKDEKGRAAVPLPFMGPLPAAEALALTDERRARLKNRFVDLLAAALLPVASAVGLEEDGSLAQEPDKAEHPVGRELADGLLMLFQEKDSGQGLTGDSADNAHPGLTLLNDAGFELPDELADIARQVSRAEGGIPSEYIVSAAGRAGSGLAVNRPIEGPDGEAAPEEGAHQGMIRYDEWDYRRQGFRKNWCHLRVREVSPLGGTFVNATLGKYKGLLSNLKRQFEMMSLRERLVKRRRDGDEIDLDAVIEAVADSRAGLAPSERLFIRRRRDDRDIAALFLVDMSSSTEGWVGTAIKESLILMCEALEVLGDRLAIYGFSGMRRTRCEMFTVKEFSEPYTGAVKDRIAAIAPREYTRMGPALRHAATILGRSDAAIRLLVTLTDGKPEDYDGYKGAYAIEDTRHALIEAKAAGIHPFCITVDRTAHDYMARMFGEVNYIFIDDVTRLPVRMPEIYRNLTT